MKKFFKYAMMAVATVAAMTFTACSDDDDEVKNYPLTITFNAPSDVNASNISNIKVIVKGTAGADTVTMNSLASQTLTLTQGTYDITVSGKVIDEATAYVQGTVTAELFEEKSVAVNLSKYNKSPLVFKTLHTTGSALYYVLDSYLEIANNSDEVQYLDGLILAAPLGNLKAQSVWQTAFPDKYQTDGLNGIILAFPGTGKDYPLQPGEFIVMADQALNHKTAYDEDADADLKAQYAKAPDLSKANFEKYFGNGDIDNPDVPNMEIVLRNNKYMKMWAFGAAGRAYMLAKLPEGMTWQQFVADESNYEAQPNTESAANTLMIPSKYILDAVDIYMNGVDAADNYPFFLAKDDAKGIEGNESYSSLCVRRKVEKIENGRVYYKDTNRSADDFKRAQDNTPGVIPTAVD